MFWLILITLLFGACAACWLLWPDRSGLGDNNKLRGYHVVITGGSSGIGLSLAKLFCESEARVTLVARDLARLEAAQTNLRLSRAGTAQVDILSVDLCEPYDELEQHFKEFVDRKGPIDILIHCAGYAVSRTFVETPASEIERLMKTNYLSAVNLTRAVLPHMVSDKTHLSTERRIAFVCSMAAQVGVYGFAAYCGSKYALRGFSEVLRMELENSGPMVTLVFPPDTDTPGLANENIGKPTATLEISSAGGLASSDSVAEVIFHDILAGKLNCSFGLEGKALSWATSGLLPALSTHTTFNNPFQFIGSIVGIIAEVLAASPLRAFGIGYAWWMRRIVRKHTLTNRN